MLLLLPFLLFGCAKSNSLQEDTALQRTMDDLKELGFNLDQGFYPYEDGYIVEYDILLYPDDIEKLKASLNGQHLPTSSSLEPLQPKQTGESIAHYRTREIVNISNPNAQRTISLYIDPALGTKLNTALAETIRRYNVLQIKLHFRQVYQRNQSDIAILAVSSAPYLMAAGFPTNNNPYPTILVNTSYYNDQANRQDLASTLAHEIGHCIGFRHTDFMSRRFSCNGTDLNEGQSTSGAIHIPGTPVNPEANSWMLACSSNRDRPFTAYDIIALNTVYPHN